MKKEFEVKFSNGAKASFEIVENKDSYIATFFTGQTSLIIKDIPDAFFISTKFVKETETFADKDFDKLLDQIKSFITENMIPELTFKIE
jgi:hypothetical protein